ncbi:hypothetical protein [Streptomyces sp. CL12-4]|uniref:hypothetical protein n=1 Tax=Streptomyces sp. CL12-4 TaxID=2810306 RepID=UPI001EFAB9A8|nr:hypothetical protein [Streptomyces sp. CL12-4]MCG8966273.1 hypothetical protein [Streptomyces sp. CL12-4]
MPSPSRAGHGQDHGGYDMRAFAEAASGRAVDADPVDAGPVASFPLPTALARSAALDAGIRPGPVVPPVPACAPTAHEDPADPVARAGLRRLVGPDTAVAVPGAPTDPEGRRTSGGVPGGRLVDTALHAAPDPRAVRPARRLTPDEHGPSRTAA